MPTSYLVQNNRIQVSVMPTASSDLLGKVVQYVGESDGENLVHGHFYTCTEVTTPGEPTTYSWVSTDTQSVYSLPIASADTLGGVKVGSNLSIDENGVLSGTTPYSLPTASDTTLGGVKVGNNLSINNGVLSVAPETISQTVSTYCAANFSEWSGALDSTLESSVMAAPADKVGEIKSALSDLDDVLKAGKYNFNNFVQGYRGRAGNVILSTNRCTTANVFKLNVGDTISIKNIDNGLKVGIVAVETIGVDPGSFLYDSGWKTEDFSYTVLGGNSGFYMVNISASDGVSDISPSDISTFIITIMDTMIKNLVDIDKKTYNPLSLTTTIKGGIVSTTGTIDTSANAAIVNLNDLHQESVFINKGEAELLFYNYADGYLGKVNASGLVDKSAGNWTKFTSYVPITKYAKQIVSKIDYVMLVLIPPSGTAISNDAEASTYANDTLIMDVSSVIEDFVNSKAKTIGSDYYIGTDFQKHPVKVEQVGRLTYQQSFCIYNGYFYSIQEGHISKQDSTFTEVANAEISVGHGNVFQLGNSHYAYVSGMSDGKVYKVDLDTLSVSDTYTLPNFEGTQPVEDVAVDEDRGLMYIIMHPNRGLPTTPEPHHFITYDYINDEVLSDELTLAFSCMQAVDMFNDLIYLVMGTGTVTYPNYFKILTRKNEFLGEYVLGTFASAEPEGVCFDRDTHTLYISLVNRYLYKVTLPTYLGLN